MNIIIALLVFTVIVVLHELGHFLLAKKNGVGVIEFSVGMGPRLITVVKTEKGMSLKLVPSQKYCEEREDWQNHTLYSWKLLPIGGSCMMVGEDEENDAENSFQEANTWGKIAIIAAGPIFNFLSAFVFAIILIACVGYNSTEVTYVDPNSSAAEAGIKEGDRITKINGEKMQIGQDVNNYLSLHPTLSEDVEMEYITSDGENKSVQVSPKYGYYRLGYTYNNTTNGPVEVSEIEDGKPMAEAGVKVGDVITQINGTKIANIEDMSKYLQETPLTKEDVTIVYERNGQSKEITITPFYDTRSDFLMYCYDRQPGNVWQVVKYGVVEIRYWIETTVKSLGLIVTGKVGTDQISGVVGVVDVIGQTVDASPTTKDVLLNLLNIAILLSANLGVMNLLPFPALDGGRLVFLFVEAVRGKPVNQKIEGTIHLIGIMLLMLLMVAVTYNDILRIVK